MTAPGTLDGEGVSDLDGDLVGDTDSARTTCDVHTTAIMANSNSEDGAAFSRAERGLLINLRKKHDTITVYSHDAVMFTMETA